MSDAPKSAFEIAMEKLRAGDAARGEPRGKKLSASAKERIAEIRRFYESKLAECEILFKGDREKALADPDKLKQVEEGYRTDRRRLESERDAKIAKIRG
jgi:hypothetical protein